MSMKNLIDLDGKLYDISGPAGNAFAILANVKTWLAQCGVSKADQNAFIEEATAGDYDYLLATAAAATNCRFVNGVDDV